MAIDKHGTQRSIEIPLVRGMNEASVKTKLDKAELMWMKNFRTSEAGDAIEKRDGVTQITDATQTTFGDKDVYGYHVYTNTNGDYCQLVVTEDKLWRKIGAAAWATLNTWGSSVTHQVQIHAVQDKHIIVTDVENYCVWYNNDHGNFGITAPATLPTLAAAWNAALLEEDCAAIGDWLDLDTGAGASTQATFQTKSCFRFLNTGAATDAAIRGRVLTKLSAVFALDFGIYMNTIGKDSDGDQAGFVVHAGTRALVFHFDSTNLIFAQYPEGAASIIYHKVGWKPYEDTWYDIRVLYDGSDENACTATVYIDGRSYGTYDCTYLHGDTSQERITFTVQGFTVATDVYLDYVDIGDVSEPAGPNGLYRYAVTYARNGGNYPAESNPIKSLIGAPSQTGAGLDDLTMSGTYTGINDITLRVEIDGTGATDTIKVSYDGGLNWHLSTLPMTSIMYLQYGIELNWAATTGHTSADYWDVSCEASSVLATNQKVTISSIPVSSDSQVSQRKVYRTTAGGTRFYLCAILNDNTTTSFIDNIPDSALGISMEEDHDVPPTGELSLWWDDRSWILDVDENVLYYSQANAPEHFNLSGPGARYVSFRSGKADDGCTGLMDFKAFLYVFKRDSIFLLRKKLTDAYSRHIVINDVGCVAPHSIVAVQNAMFFLSERGWESFNGSELYDIKFSDRLKTTLKVTDYSNAKYISSAHHKEYNEVILNIPDRTGTNTYATLVYNYKHGVFYRFEFSKTPSCIFSARDSSKNPIVVIGTRDGFCGYLDGSTQDFGTNINATAFASWVAGKGKGMNLLHHVLEFQAPTGITLTSQWYADFQKTYAKNFTWAGKTPAGAIYDMRYPIIREEQLDIHCKYFFLYFINAENVGGDLKIINSEVFYQDEKYRKGEIVPD